MVDAREFDRRRLLAGMAALAVAAGSGLAPRARAAGLGGSLLGLLGKASDSALAKLALPGAFYADPAVRIGLPLIGGAGGKLGSVLNAGARFGLLDGFTRKLNDAAGAAAGEAKPVFRAAIDRLTLADVPGIVTQNDGATQYLRTSAGGELQGKLRPLIDSALVKAGAFRQLDKLTARSGLLQGSGIGRDSLGKSVTEQALNGIFRYIGAEEGKLRADPLGKAGGLLNGVLGN